MTILQLKISSPVGPLYLIASIKGLRGVFLEKQNVKLATSKDSLSPELKILKIAENQLRKYFKGELKSFKIPFDLNGTAFQKRVWEELTKIPYGKTCSYSQIAANLKKKKAFRAVGNANGKNPLCIIIPCHRVIAADGSLGGYSGGLGLKRKLLSLEKKNAYDNSLRSKS